MDGALRRVVQVEFWWRCIGNPEHSKAAWVVPFHCLECLGSSGLPICQYFDVNGNHGHSYLSLLSIDNKDSINKKRIQVKKKKNKVANMKILQWYKSIIPMLQKHNYKEKSNKGNDLCTSCLAKDFAKALASQLTCLNSTWIKEDNDLISLK